MSCPARKRRKSRGWGRRKTTRVEKEHRVAEHEREMRENDVVWQENVWEVQDTEIKQLVTHARITELCEPLCGGLSLRQLQSLWESVLSAEGGLYLQLDKRHTRRTRGMPIYGEVNARGVVKLLMLLHHFLGLGAGSTLADLGCGSGKVCVLAAMMGCKLAWGVEIDKGRTESARQALEMLKAQNADNSYISNALSCIKYTCADAGSLASLRGVDFIYNFDLSHQLTYFHALEVMWQMAPSIKGMVSFRSPVQLAQRGFKSGTCIGRLSVKQAGVGGGSHYAYIYKRKGKVGE